MEPTTTTQAKAKLEEAIHSGMGRAKGVLQRVMSEIPEDAVVRADGMTFRAVTKEDGRESIVMAAHDPSISATREWGMHPHAIDQIGEIAHIPRTYTDHLLGGEAWQGEMLARLLNETYSHSGSRHLVRAVNQEARGVLSDKYRRLDARPIFDAFVATCMELGAVPFSGRGSDIRFSIRMILPKVEVIGLATEREGHVVPRNEYMAFGLEVSTSDYGNGKLAIRAFILRLACINGATAEDVMSQTHLGAKLSDDIEYSKKTLELDTRTTVSAVKDIVRGHLTGARVEALAGRIKKAQGTETNWDTLKSRLAKTLTKEELRKAEEAFKGPDVQNLPPGNTLWRASNAISWILQSDENPGRQMELEKVAWTLVPGGKKDSEAEAA